MEALAAFTLAKLIDPIGWLIMAASTYIFSFFIKKWWVIIIAAIFGAIVGEILLINIAGPTYKAGTALIPAGLAGIIQCSVVYFLAGRKKKAVSANSELGYFALINVDIESGDAELKAAPPKTTPEVDEAFEKIASKFESENILLVKTDESQLPGIDKEAIGKSGGMLIFAITSKKPITSLGSFLSYIREYLAVLIKSERGDYGAPYVVGSSPQLESDIRQLMMEAGGKNNTSKSPHVVVQIIGTLIFLVLPLLATAYIVIQL